MSDLSALRTKSGRILWRELPEEYRYRDRRTDGELGDLEAFMHGFGHMFDLIRETTEQAHADSFAEEVNGRAMQPWLVPYLAELLGAQLVAPIDEQRIEELNNSVGWYKSKGTLASVDNVADVVAGTETVSREGWRHVLTTPRMSLPPFTSPPGTNATDEAMTASMRPKGCPDFRILNRAIQDENGINPLFKIKASRDVEDSQDVYWRHWNPDGLPCFPGAYDDVTARTPDMRTPDGSFDVGPHPRRTLIHIRPPQGFFAQAVPELELKTLSDIRRALKLATNAVVNITAEDICREFDLPEVPVLKLKVSRFISFPVGRFSYRGLLFTGRLATNPGTPIRVSCRNGTFLNFENCSAERMSLAGPPGGAEEPQLTAKNCLFGEILGPRGFAQLEYCTVMENCDVMRLNASDCLLSDVGDTLVCGGKNPQSCLRYSAVDFQKRTSGQLHIRRAAAARVKSCLTGTNTTAKPNFIQLWHKNSDDTCTLRAADYGEPGYGVLDLTSPESILSGAEDDGEMGAYHNSHHVAAIRALEKKLTGFLPLGQEIAAFYDPMLVLSPPNLVAADDE